VFDVSVELYQRKVQAVSNNHIEIEWYFKENVLVKVWSEAHIFKPKERDDAQNNPKGQTNNASSNSGHCKEISDYSRITIQVISMEKKKKYEDGKSN
jgi:hypothetical protein